MDRKEVNIITTFHTAEIVDTGKLDKKTKEPIMKYAAVHDYNKYMGAVDLSDQFLTYTAVKRRTIKWWKKAFLRLFALSEVNTYLFYRETMKRKTTNTKYMDHKSFRKELCKDMTSLMPMKPLSPRLRVACVGETDIMRLSSEHFPKPLRVITTNGKTYTARKKCFVFRWEKHLTENRSLQLKKTQTYPCPLCKMPYSFHKLMPIPVLDKAIRELETRPQDKNNLIKKIHTQQKNVSSSHIDCNLECSMASCRQTTDFRFGCRLSCTCVLVALNPF